MKDRLERLEKDHAEEGAAYHEKIEKLGDELDRVKETHVSMAHFTAVIDPLRRSMNTIEKDVKELLGRVRERT